MSAVTIKRWSDGATLYEGEHATLRDAVEAAVRAGARLSGAVLSGARLSGATCGIASVHRDAVRGRP